jgi:hypothetical protein
VGCPAASASTFLDGSDEAVSAPRDRCDHTVAQQLPQGRDMDGEVALLDDTSGPDELHQLGLVDDPLPPPEQREQQVEGAAPDRQLCAARKQRAPVRHQAKRPEQIGPPRFRHGAPLVWEILGA